MYKSQINLTFTVTMVTKMATKIDREINIEHKQIPKMNFYIDENYHGTQHIKRISWYLAVLISNSLKPVSKIFKVGPKWQFLCFKPILLAIFAAITTVKLK